MQASAVRCSGCRAILAYCEMDRALRTKLFCSLECMSEVPVTEMEERNGIWRDLAVAGMSAPRIAKIFGSAHPLVYKTVAKG